MEEEIKDWIPGRNISGESGYINIKTGQFRTTLPGTIEEQQEQSRKESRTALVTHGYRLGRFNETEGKLRNHSDETVRRYVNRPILVRGQDSTIVNSYSRELAPFESPMQIVSPEFDLFVGLTSSKPIRSILDILPRKKTYTGVPHRMKSDGTFMDESFLTTKDKFDIWTSDNLDFVIQYASDEGQRFAIFGKPSKLYNLPKLNNKIVSNWEDMPYQIIKGKIVKHPDVKIKDYFTWKNGNKPAGKMYITPEYASKSKIFNFPDPETTTDKLLQSIPSKYQGIKFNNLMDGPTIINGEYFDIPVDEWVYKAGADIIKAPFNITKMNLIKNDLVDLSTKVSTIIGHNIIEQNDK